MIFFSFAGGMFRFFFCSVRAREIKVNLKNKENNNCFLVVCHAISGLQLVDVDRGDIGRAFVFLLVDLILVIRVVIVVALEASAALLADLDLAVDHATKDDEQHARKRAQCNQQWRGIDFCFGALSAFAVDSSGVLLRHLLHSLGCAEAVRGVGACNSGARPLADERAVGGGPVWGTDQLADLLRWGIAERNGADVEVRVPRADGRSVTLSGSEGGAGIADASRVIPHAVLITHAESGDGVRARVDAARRHHTFGPCASTIGRARGLVLGGHALGGTAAQRAPAALGIRNAERLGSVTAEASHTAAIAEHAELVIVAAVSVEVLGTALGTACTTNDAAQG